MKKKTKERLDRIEKRLQELVEDVQELKAPMPGTQGVKKKGIAAKTTQAKKITTKKVGKPGKAVVAKKAEAAPGKAAASKAVKKLTQEVPKNKVAAKPRRPATAKPAATSRPNVSATKRNTTTPLMHKTKGSVAPAAGLLEPKIMTSVISEAGKGGEVTN